jgi:hypothetical protein
MEKYIEVVKLDETVLQLYCQAYFHLTSTCSGSLYRFDLTLL